MRAFPALLMLCAWPAAAEHYIRIDADGRSYTLDTDSTVVLKALKPVSTAKAASKLPDWLWPVPGMLPDEVHLDIASGQVSANFRCAAALNDLAGWYRQSLLAHGFAASSLPAGAGGQQITGAAPATIITVTILPDTRTSALSVRATYMPRQAPPHSKFEALWYDDSTGILRLRETSSGDEYEIDKRAILQGNLNRPGAVESKGAGMPSWLPVYPGAMPTSKGRIHWMLFEPTAELITRDPVKQVYQYYLDFLHGTDAKVTRSGLSGSSSNGGEKHYSGEITAFRGDDKVEIEISEVNWMFGGLGAKTPEEKVGIGIRYMVPKR